MHFKLAINYTIFNLAGAMRQVLLQLSVINAIVDAQGEILNVILRRSMTGEVVEQESQPKFRLPVEVSSELAAIESIIAEDLNERSKLVAASYVS